MNRVARAGFVAYAALTVADVALLRWLQQSWQGQDPDVALITRISDVYLGVGVLAALALFLVARSPTVRGLATAAAAIAAIDLCLDLGIRFALAPSAVGIETLELVSQIRGWTRVGVAVATGLLLGVAVMRVGRAAGSRPVTFLGLGLATLAGVGAALEVLVQLGVTLPGDLPLAVHYARGLCLVAGFLGCAAVGGRIAIPPVDPGARARLDPAWRGVAAGIRLCLLAGAARVVFAVLAILVMRGTAGASDFSDLHRIGEQVFGVAVLSGIAGLVLLAGLFGLTRAPSSAAMAPAATAAMVLFVIGMGVDALATKLTLDAFESVSAAFRAQDALPGVAALAAAVGVGVASATLIALGSAATALERADLAESASTTITLVVLAGLGGGALQLLAGHLPFEAFIVIALVILPLGLVAAVRFVLLAVRVAREIDERVG